MVESNFLPKEYHNIPESGNVSWRSPSNIALVKYWGKYGEQLPKNPSISFTLSNCHTTTSLEYTKKTTKGFDFEVYLDGKREQSFEPKISKFFERISPYIGYLEDYSFKIETSNSFPHSSGIASSASGMSALALCLVSMEEKLVGEASTGHSQTQKASFLARLGSGSACRSVEGPLVVWGKHQAIDGSSNLYGSKYPYEIHPHFRYFQDTILLVDKGEKEVSSTVGHGLMNNHPFAEARFEQALKNLTELNAVLQSGDLLRFVKIVEEEALSLHAMMLTSDPNFILMKPNTLEILNRIGKFRRDTGTVVCYTLDAGANVHVLFPKAEKEKVSAFIQDQLVQFCKNGEFIKDLAGQGAIKL